MFIDASTYKRNGKTYRRVLLRNSYRVNGKVCHDTIANLSACSDEEVKALKLALKNKHHLETLTNSQQNIQTKQGLGVGAIWVLYQLAKQLGLTQALGNTRQAKLALWLIMACVMEQGSRLSAVRLAQRHHVCDIVELSGFNENDLYVAMDELAKKQKDIEKTLFDFRYGNEKPHFYLYDVTSSYFEGEQNELANYGYNRDKKQGKKQGKKQIVIGLMTDDIGQPIAIEVFEGNTQDPKTVHSQIEKMAKRFDVKQVTLVGDRGMIKQAQINELHEHNFQYITAITKPQIESLIKKDIIQLSLFDDELGEVVEDGIRYVLHRNPVRAQEIALCRESKLIRLQTFLDKKNKYLAEHSKAKTDTALCEVNKKCKQLKMDSWLTVLLNDRHLSIEMKAEEIEKISQLDGCYVIKSDVPCEMASTEKLHSRYKDLALVEKAFRTMKTTLLEMRGIYVRKSDRTRAHVFIVMLAYLLVHKLQQSWHEIEMTVEEGIAELASICSLEIHMPGHAVCHTIPEPRAMGKILLERLGVVLPDAIAHKAARVVTTKKLVSERK